MELGHRGLTWWYTFPEQQRNCVCGCQAHSPQGVGKAGTCLRGEWWQGSEVSLGFVPNLSLRAANYKYEPWM
jgi:hypothetical protein